MPTSTLSSPTLTVQVSGNISNASNPLAPANASVSLQYRQTPTVGTNIASGGTGATRNNAIYSSVVATGTSGITLDLAALTDPLGGALNFQYITEIVVANASTNAGQGVVVSGSWSGTTFTNVNSGVLSPNISNTAAGLFIFTDPIGATVTPTGKTVIIRSLSGSAVPVNVIIKGIAY